MLDLLGDGGVAAVFGLGGGVLIGLAARLGRFCSLGAIEDAVLGRTYQRLSMWGVAIGVAILGTFALAATGHLDIALTTFHRAPFSPALVLGGSLLFGYGMALAGNCGFGALARLGGGDLRSFVIVLVLGISAFVTLSGPLAPIRVALVEWTRVELPSGGIPGLLELAGIPHAMTFLAIGGMLLGVGLIGVGRDASAVTWSAMVGLAVISGWAGTYWIATTGFDEIAVVSHTFSAPVGDTILYAMTASGGGLGFGIGSVVGVALGAVLGSVRKGHFRWEACEDPRELRRQIGGAALMGVGAALAVGCTVGQGISAFSTLAYGAPIAVAGIYAGAALGLNQLVLGRFRLSDVLPLSRVRDH